MSIADPTLDPEVEGPALKPHKGRIDDWIMYLCGDDHGLGYLVAGRFLDHFQFNGLYGHTSWIEKHDKETGEVETRNSRYTLVGPPAFDRPIKYGTRQK